MKTNPRFHALLTWLTLLHMAISAAESTCGSSEDNPHSLAAVARRNFLIPTYFTGSRPEDYVWSSPSAGTASIQAKPGVSRDGGSYMAVWQQLFAQPYWGQRVLLRAFATVSGVGANDYSALFVRVLARNGQTLVFDNMVGRRFSGWQWKQDWLTVVVDVPGPPPGDVNHEICFNDGDPTFPAAIAAGFLLSGGRGSVQVQLMSLDVVGNKVPVTGGPPPWEPPYAF